MIELKLKCHACGYERIIGEREFIEDLQQCPTCDSDNIEIVEVPTEDSTPVREIDRDLPYEREQIVMGKTFKYRCEACKKKFSGKKLEVCPYCNSEWIRKEHPRALLCYGSLLVIQSIIVWVWSGWQTECGGFLANFVCRDLVPSEIYTIYWISFIFFIIGLVIIAFYVRGQIRNRRLKVDHKKNT